MKPTYPDKCSVCGKELKDNDKASVLVRGVVTKGFPMPKGIIRVNAIGDRHVLCPECASYLWVKLYEMKEEHDHEER